MTTTAMIRKDLWAVRTADKAAVVRLVNKVWMVEPIDAAFHLTFTNRTVALAAAATMVAA